MNKYESTYKQSKIWAYAAWTSPFVALAILVGLNIFGFEEIQQKISLLISVLFIFVSVFWWWWALDKIVYMIERSKRSEENFEMLLKELKESKVLLNDLNNDSNR